MTTAVHCRMWVDDIESKTLRVSCIPVWTEISLGQEGTVVHSWRILLGISSDVVAGWSHGWALGRPTRRRHFPLPQRIGDGSVTAHGQGILLADLHCPVRFGSTRCKSTTSSSQSTLQSLLFQLHVWLRVSIHRDVKFISVNWCDSKHEIHFQFAMSMLHYQMIL